MKLKLILATLTLSLLSSAAMAGSAADAIKAAKSAKKEAAAVGFEWSKMGKMIKKAEALAKDGKEKKAIKLANLVAAQGKAALKQAELGKTAAPTF
jgi:hypothetical protein